MSYKQEKLFKTGYSVLYIIGEEHGGEYLKIGRTLYSKGDNPVKERLRALQQGNPNKLCCFYYLTGFSKFVITAEKRVHKQLKNNYQCLVDKTGATGHGEWYNIKLDDAIALLDAEWDLSKEMFLEKYLDSSALYKTAKIFGGLYENTI